MKTTKAVIPVGGLGTRFLPATKATPKEMLPVVDRPAIEYVVREAAAANLSDVLLITGRSKYCIMDHFDRAWDLERALEAKGKTDMLAAIREPAELATIHTIRQHAPRGLGHAVFCAREHVGDEPFAVLLGDDLIDARDPLLPAMIAVQERLGGSVVAIMEFPREQISLYGSATATPVDSQLLTGLHLAAKSVFRLTDLVEKPSLNEVPSNYAIVGRYILSPKVFDVLENQPPGQGNEIQLTDALGTLSGMDLADGGGVHGVVFSGRRYDTGDKLDYLKAVVRLAGDHPDLGADFAAWLRQYVAEGMNSPGSTGS
ncbi:MAG: UTP--glucose-1-phosphate uridylyltransferase [Micrococcales bacterium]|nr:UTP--glucose-1-phosphate uridylyltransferase [Micrococcales bacterium]